MSIADIVLKELGKQADMESLGLMLIGVLADIQVEIATSDIEETRRFHYAEAIALVAKQLKERFQGQTRAVRSPIPQIQPVSDFQEE